MEDIAKSILLLYGPLALGWVAAGLLWWRNERRPRAPCLLSTDHQSAQKLLDDYHNAIVENTRVTERLAVLIEERTRLQSNRERQ